MRTSQNKFVKKNQWELPGGLLEVDEDLEKGIKREVLEETGLKIKIKKLKLAFSHNLSNFEFNDGRKIKEGEHICFNDETR